MTTGRTKTTGAALERFPEFPPRPDMQNLLYLHDQGHVPALKNHFGDLESTLVLGEVPVGWNTRQERAGIRIPDLIVAFNIDRAQVVEQMGYSINEQGKPPDFVLEVASYNTAMNDEGSKRISYERFGIPEYWRFDPSGGRYYEQPLAGDRLGEDGSYHLHSYTGQLRGSPVGVQREAGVVSVLGTRATALARPRERPVPEDLYRGTKRPPRRGSPDKGTGKPNSSAGRSNDILSSNTVLNGDPHRA